MKIKNSFPPLADGNTEVLILGSLPGDTSIELQEYYGHPRNRFWKILSSIYGKELPISYENKKKLLSEIKVGVWDVAKQAERKGSLDTDIRKEEPNDLNEFLQNHPKIRTIAFNGQKAEKMYDKYFERIPTIHYVSLPSSSPANARFTNEKLIDEWGKALQH